MVGVSATKRLLRGLLAQRGNVIDDEISDVRGEAAHGRAIELEIGERISHVWMPEAGCQMPDIRMSARNG
jgi:hypothetical protein